MLQYNAVGAVVQNVINIFHEYISVGNIEGRIPQGGLKSLSDDKQSV